MNCLSPVLSIASSMAYSSAFHQLNVQTAVLAIGTSDRVDPFTGGMSMLTSSDTGIVGREAA
jgi:hypothetical protein